MVSILAYGPRCPGFDFKIKIRCLLRLINSTAWRFRLESNTPRLGPVATQQNALHNANNYTWSFFFKNCPSRGSGAPTWDLLVFVYFLSLNCSTLDHSASAPPLLGTFWNNIRFSNVFIWNFFMEKHLDYIWQKSGIGGLIPPLGIFFCLMMTWREHSDTTSTIQT